jgi:hypothetical protein
MKFLLVTLLFFVLFPVPATAFQLPDTGQTKCYQAVSPYAEISCANTGQDGAYSINPIAYIDNGNGTVTDKNTGLVWQRCSVGQNNDASCSGTAETFTWYQAAGVYDANYNSSSQNVCGTLTWGGQTGWRLPTKKELMSIVNYAIPYPVPTVTSAFFPNTVASGYWPSTTYAINPSTAWWVDFSDGASYYFPKYFGFYVRCVRGGQ